AGSGRCRATSHDNHDAPSPNGRVKAAAAGPATTRSCRKARAPAEATAHRRTAAKTGPGTIADDGGVVDGVRAIAPRPGRNGRVAQPVSVSIRCRPRPGSPGALDAYLVMDGPSGPLTAARQAPRGPGDVCAAWDPLGRRRRRNATKLETQLGVTTRETTEDPQVTEDQHVAESEILHVL